MPRHKHFERSEVVGKKEKHVDNCTSEAEPDASRFAWDESLPNGEETVDPKDLAAEQHHVGGEPDQEIKKSHVAEARGKPERASSDQQGSDHALAASMD